jgi:hypothetical protein
MGGRGLRPIGVPSSLEMDFVPQRLQYPDLRSLEWRVIM